MFYFFFFNDTATTEIYTLSLHDALPIYMVAQQHSGGDVRDVEVRRDQRTLGALARTGQGHPGCADRDRKSTRLNSSHLVISYAVFCLKKKNNTSYQYYTHTH